MAQKQTSELILAARRYEAARRDLWIEIRKTRLSLERIEIESGLDRIKTELGKLGKILGTNLESPSLTDQKLQEIYQPQP